MITKIKQCLALTFSLLLLAACTSDSARFEERITRLRNEVRGSFSPKFDPIWIAREKKAAQAKKELARLVGVMEEALDKVEGYTPPPDMVDLHTRHRELFSACKKALLQIVNEAEQDKPDGMKAVRIYQEMTRRFLALDEAR